MRKALIVVDMLNDFIDPKGALYCGDTVPVMLQQVTARVNEYRKADKPVIFLADSHAEDDLEFERFPKHCVTGTWGAEIISLLTPLESEAIVRKTRYSGFYGTALDVVLDPHFGLAPQNSIIEVCGVCTSICVQDTIGDLANRDFATVVHRNCVADFDPEMHEMALKRMASLYGTVII